MKLVYGVGINDKKYPSVKDGKLIKEYDLWKSMLRRVFKNKSYLGCSVSENFKSYSYFYKWCQEQIGFKNNDWQLDKDLLRKGNKIYSEDSCFFVPKEINMFIVKNNKLRGEYPIGVSFDKRKGLLVASISINQKNMFIGYFDDVNSAFIAYKNKKEDLAKVIAEKYKDVIDPAVYLALLNYCVEITD